MYRRFGKRLFDLVVGGIAVLTLSPFIVITWILVTLRVGTPALFRQKRAGHRGAAFYIFKFRTMTNARDETGQLLPDDQRLTPLGVTLRTLSLDELPGLLNVLRGEMSLVGPRPLLYGYLPHYNDYQQRRHDVRPGITGWAQINGRNTLTWDQKFDYDVWYVENVSFWLDVRIIFMTAVGLIRPRAISAEGHATMPLFAPVDDLKGLGAERPREDKD